MDLQTLSDTFAIPGVLAFSALENGLLRADVTSPTCSAEIYLQGAHLTSWQPVDCDPVIFVSERSLYEPGKAIRGGVPIIFPWFGPRTATPGNPRTDGPAHGFARTSVWELAFAAVAGDNLHLTFTLGPDETTAALGYEHFRLAVEFVLGSELRIRLTVANQDTTPLHFEEALHSYFTVGNAETVTLDGLAGTTFIDKTDAMKRKVQAESTLGLSAETDRLYLNTDATVTLEDGLLRRKITVAKTNSNSTVIWNPWSELSAKMTDMAPDSWRTMTCIETVNASDNAVTLAPGQAHTMEAHVTVQAIG
jgi:glucose-6-phosphate 1-epimerase